jgi:hypothetical protein
VLHVWEVEQGRRLSEAKQRTVQADEERQRQERPEEAPRPVPPHAKFVASVPPVEATDAGRTTVPVDTPTPEPSDPPGDTPAGVRPTRRRLLVAGLALAGLLVASGVAYAQYGRDGGEDVPVGVPSPGASTGPTATPSPTTPADELCTDEIKSNQRWVCLTSAVVANSKFTVKYTVEYAGSTPHKTNGYHLHIYGSDGKNPPDYAMSSHWPMSKGKYYWEDRQTSVLDTSDPRFKNAIGNARKVCARIAYRGHGLIPDINKGYETGNCVPITRS